MANVRFEFSDMEHPTADTPADTEVWTTARGLYKAELHWELGHTPDWVVCYFHDATAREFPWTRVRAADENGPIGIWRFDTIEQMFEGGSRQWKATGRDALYGVQDNYMRSPRIKVEEAASGAVDDDPDYIEWPIVTPASVLTLEDLESDINDFRFVNSRIVINATGCGSFTNPCDAADYLSVTPPQTRVYAVFDRNSDRDTFLDNNFAESRFNSEPSKLGPNYALKGVRRGWVFKDIMRHSSGSVNVASRPILAVYNRSLGGVGSIAGEGTPINSNFQQAMSAGSGANALAYDVAVSWPWLAPAAQIEVEEIANPANTSGADVGYDYRTVWTGKTDTYAPSGQAVEVFRRGDLEWDDAQGFSCGGENEPCPDEGPDGVITIVLYFQTGRVIKFFTFDHYPTRAEICDEVPVAQNTLIAGMGVIVTVIDTGVAAYDLDEPASISEWISRLGLSTLRGLGLGAFGTNGQLVCSLPQPTIELPGGEDIEEGGRCWCVTHLHPFLGTQFGLIGIWMTPTIPASAKILAAPSDKTCGELSLASNMAVFLHQTDVSKDYLCYHRL